MKKLIGNFIQQPLYLKITIVLSFLVFIISLTQPAFYTTSKDDPNADFDGFTLFFLGWTSSLSGAFIPFIFWLANPLYLVAIFFTSNNKSLRLYLSLAATLIAFRFCWVDSLITRDAGGPAVITSHGPGFIWWLISFTILTLGLTADYLLTNKKRNE